MEYFYSRMEIFHYRMEWKWPLWATILTSILQQCPFHGHNTGHAACAAEDLHFIYVCRSSQWSHSQAVVPYIVVLSHMFRKKYSWKSTTPIPGLAMMLSARNAMRTRCPRATFLRKAWNDSLRSMWILTYKGPPQVQAHMAWSGPYLPTNIGIDIVSLEFWTR